ncbi:unnamed protein product [Rotaria sordida]|uniref:UPAR/Ly6 domain-containing protein n=1 Tax=Rotaria sordida TaxID=392033 RepID=A0A818WF50_9BILA|nr:unnamed protein product [Rotaria sordida]CAF3724032.1 unnamed protein product [Rotaria sordida]
MIYTLGYSNGLVCYVCQNCADPADLNEFTNNTCPGPCMKINTFIPTMGSYIYKTCTETCTEKKLYFGFSKFEVHCCNNTDRCNTGQRSTFFNHFTQLVMTFASVTFSFLLFNQLTTIVILLNYATCFDCYDCQNCEIPANDQANTATCSSSVTQCMKITAKLGTVYTYVLKQCGPCSNETFAFGVTFVQVDCCTGSKCNGTNTLSFSEFSIIIYVLFFIIYFKCKNELYINHIYKRKRPWHEITLPLTNKSVKNIDQNLISLLPRQSITPLIQEYLPYGLKKSPIQRKMITQLQFNEPPLFINNFKEEWDEMDTKSIFSLRSISTRTSYYTIREQTFCDELILDEKSLIKYSSLTSSNKPIISSPSSIEQLSSISNSSKPTSLQLVFKPCISLSKQLLNNEKSISDQNNSSNYIVLNMDNFKEINIFNNLSHV